MNYRKFGNTDLLVSEIGLGCASLGGGLYHRDDKESINTILKAYDWGVNFFDTSEIHSLGNSQKLLGIAIKGKRDRVIISSKTGVTISALGRMALEARHLVSPVSFFLRPVRRFLHLLRMSQRKSDFSESFLMQNLDTTLKLLQTDYLDLFLLYNPPCEVIRGGDVIETLETMKRQGKIRHYGVACHRIEDALLCSSYSGVSSLQVDISLLDQEPVISILPLAVEKGIAVIGNHPRAMGLLTNNYFDMMGDTSFFDNKEFAKRKDKAREFRFLIKENRTLSQAAIQYVLQLEGIAVQIPRSVNRAELEENLGALSAPPLTKEELEKIRLLS